MKKITIVFTALLFLVISCAMGTGEKVSKATKGKVSSLASQYRGKQGVEVIEIGRIGASLIKGVASLTNDYDKNISDALSALKDIKGLTIISYESADTDLKQKINENIEKVLSGVDLLMDARDEGESNRIYGYYDENTGKVSDVALFSSDGTFIYLVGSFNLDDISKLME